MMKYMIHISMMARMILQKTLVSTMVLQPKVFSEKIYASQNSYDCNCESDMLIVVQ